MQRASGIAATLVEITPGRMRVHVSIAPGSGKRTDGAVADAALSRFPELAIHSCINSHGPTFGDVISSTSMAHLLEHLIIAIQAREYSKMEGFQDVTIVGTTEALRPSSDGSASTVVDVAFADDLVAAAALTEALEFLNSL